MTTENDNIEPEEEIDENGEVYDHAAYLKAQREAYGEWLTEQTEKGPFVVMVHGACGMDSPPLNSIEECEKWVSENLPIGIQKCRTGSYSIGKVNE